MVGTKLYVDFMSQPARAIIIFCRAAGIKVELVQTLISKGQHLQGEYKSVNPLGKIPCLSEGDFSLGESAAIMTYLANTNDIADHWYPADPRKRARVESAMHWHHSNVRKGAAGLVFNRILAPRLGKVMDRKAAEEAEAVLTAALKMLERFWLASGTFLAGSEISIADLLLVTELDMLHMLAGATEGKSREELLQPFPKVVRWMTAVAQTCSPHHSDVSKVLMKSAAAAARQKEAEPRAKL